MFKPCVINVLNNVNAIILNGINVNAVIVTPKVTTANKGFSIYIMVKLNTTRNKKAGNIARSTINIIF
jgi:hypothetical protein